MGPSSSEILATTNQELILWLAAHIGTVLCNNILGLVADSGFTVKSTACKVVRVSSEVL